MKLTPTQARVLRVLAAGGSLTLCRTRKVGSRHFEERIWLQAGNGPLERCRRATVDALTRWGAIRLGGKVANIGGGFNTRYELTDAGRAAAERTVGDG